MHFMTTNIPELWCNAVLL